MEPVAFLIQAHEGLDQLERLVRVLAQANCDIFIHFCKSGHLPRDFQHELTRKHHCVSFTEKRILSSWGSIGQVLASLELLKAALGGHTTYKYLILLSGVDYPIKDMDTIAGFFAGQSKSFLEFFPLVDEEWNYGGLRRIDRFHLGYDKKSFLGYACRYLKYPKRRWFDDRIIPYRGSNWWSLTADAAEYALRTLVQDERYIRFFRWSYLPDEMVFQTVLINSPFHNSLENNAYRFVRYFSKKRDYLRLKILGRNGICTLTDGYRQELLDSDALFGRKFDVQASAGLLDWLDREIHGVSSS